MLTQYAQSMPGEDRHTHIHHVYMMLLESTDARAQQPSASDLATVSTLQIEKHKACEPYQARNGAPVGHMFQSFKPKQNKVTHTIKSSSRYKRVWLCSPHTCGVIYTPHKIHLHAHAQQCGAVEKAQGEPSTAQWQ